MFVRPLGYYGVYAKKLFVRVPRLKKMFTGGHCHSRAIPSAPPPPAEATKLITPLRSTPPPELSASTAELTITITITTATLRGLFSEGLFPGRWGTKKKDKNSLWVKSYLLSYSCKDRQQQQPTTITNYHHETLLRFIRQLHRPQPDGALKWLC